MKPNTQNSKPHNTERNMTDKYILKAVKAGYHKECKFNLGEGFYLESHTTKSVFGNYNEWYFQVSYDDKHYGKEIKVGHFFYDQRRGRIMSYDPRRDGIMSVEKCAEKLSDMVADFYTKITSKEDFTLLDLKRLIGGRENFHYGEWDFFRLIFVNGKFWGSIGGEDISPIEKERSTRQPNEKGGPIEVEGAALVEHSYCKRS